MNFTVEQSYLKDALNKTSHAIASRWTLPILSHVLIEAKDDRVTFTATDLDTCIRYEVPAAVKEGGALAVPATRLKEYVSKLKDGTVCFRATDGVVAVTAGRGELKLVSSPHEDYPTLPVIEGACFTLPAGQVRDALRLTTFACSKEDSRSLLKGLLFEARDKSVTLVSTDTHRLAWKQLEASIDTPNFNAIVIGDAMETFRRFIPYRCADMNVSVTMGTATATFKFDQLTLTCRVLDGKFPNYEKVLPDSFIQRIAVNALDFAGLLERTLVIAQECSKKVSFTIDGATMRATTGDKYTGTVTEEMDISGSTQPLTIAWNVKYLSELLHMLKPLKSKMLTIAVNGPLNVGVIAVDDCQKFKYILMPMQV